MKYDDERCRCSMVEQMKEGGADEGRWSRGRKVEQVEESGAGEGRWSR